MPEFQHIAIIASGESKEDLQADSRAYLVTTGAAGGAAVGAAAGATIGLACGPLAFICAPAGALAGAIGGAVGAGWAQHEISLTQEHTQQVNEVLDNLRTDLEPNEMLRQSLSATLPDSVKTVQSDAEAHVQLRVKSLELRQHKNEKLSLNITAEMKASWDFETGKPSFQTNRYQYETARESVEDWLANEGEGFSRGVRQCMDRIAGYMARDLGYPGEPEIGS